MNRQDERREAVCRACPDRRAHGVYRWCLRDETGLEMGDCPRSRNARFNSRLTMIGPTCDRWRDPAAICLTEVPTVVYTADKENCRARHPRVTEMLERLGFADWRFHWGPVGEPYWQAIRPDYCRLLRENKPPFLILEDDIALREFHAWISPPAGAQLVYLGGGGCWRGGGLIRDARQHLPDHKITRVNEIGIEELPDCPGWVRPFGMFGTHAILYTDAAAMLEVADVIEAGSGPVDVEIGRNQWRWLCVLPRVPMFWQDDGHNGGGTFDYMTKREDPKILDGRWNRERLRAARGR